MTLTPARAADSDELRRFLRAADLTLAGLDDPSVRLWIERDPAGEIVGSTGYESSGRHVLIRSVAVAAGRRASGAGSRLARFAIQDASARGAERAWLFSRRSGPFWRTLGFAPADREALAAALPEAHQVRLFLATGQFEREVAWSRPLGDDDHRPPSASAASSARR
ncbi:MULTISPECIES: GNAT family N-acetyltransferase [unclassified Rathayibacter]|uniref:GNAT family N-acetyltransferase n=1 Tax=unclassified Rathayibacter TaxID=2609250 RepID=UPI00188B3949|nr:MULTISPECIES: GNAT family N-acetyltransferase [unclassified Rathayibacter]MBF4463050.1 GNAT family N-acetyltransferase [Rathayibacter sp. VKM Ac-2879]MBF4504713.1 GNAT family N-acetyltransferase [Rathayibacter sp. VKM Ac-2878]